MRVSTELITLVNQSKLTQEDMMGILSALLDKQKVDAFVANQELDFAYEHKQTTRLRGNAFFHKGHIGIALRIIPKVRTLAELHLPESLAAFARKKQGFFLVVGPVGQGKSTTLSAMIDLINSERPEHIMTIEDPIEYVFEEKHAIIDQREIGIDTKDFHSGLRSVFREDVNVIMVGEMRSPETISTAVTAAETGHLVFSTLHTNTASQTIDRIIDSFPGDQQDQIRGQLAESLLGIFSQRLIPRITGGLVPAYELLINNNAISNLIREKRTHEIDVVIETGTEQGMVDMNRSLLDLVRAGEITMESAYLFSMNPKGLEQIM
jgi:twitching motility protein PilT